MADDLSSNPQFRDLMDRVSSLERGTPLYSASVTEGELRFIGGKLRIESGGRMEIEGTLEVNGTTTVTGTFNVAGPWELEGNGEITGDVDLSGDMDVTGDIEVLSGGRIKIGNIILNPTDEGGSLDFGGGKKVHAGSGFLGLYNGSSFIAFNSSGVGMGGASGPVLNIGPSGLQISNLPTRTATETGLGPGALFYQAGFIYRVVPG
jgi:cytoskeletal protein CcmA (bactofilin family)